MAGHVMSILTHACNRTVTVWPTRSHAEGRRTKDEGRRNREEEARMARWRRRSEGFDLKQRVRNKPFQMKLRKGHSRQREQGDNK